MVTIMSVNHRKKLQMFGKGLLWVLNRVGIAFILLFNDVLGGMVGDALQVWLRLDEFPTYLAVGFCSVLVGGHALGSGL